MRNSNCCKTSWSSDDQKKSCVAEHPRVHVAGLQSPLRVTLPVKRNRSNEASLRMENSCRSVDESEDSNVVFLPEALRRSGNCIGRLHADFSGALETEELALRVARFDYTV